MEILEVWRNDARRFREYGATATADIVEAMVGQLQAYVTERELQELTITEASKESGLSTSALYKQIESGRLENVGRKRAPRVRRKDLPRKGKRGEDVPSIVDALIDGL